jgi:DegV family protein with EDD domain
MTIRIVTDSTCDVPPQIAQDLGIRIIPVYINIGDKSYLDGVDLSRRDFFINLPDYEIFPTTAAPASGTFTAAYQELIEEGATEIISLHIADSLSNTFNAARLGAEDIDGASIYLWDTKQITAGSGLQVIAAAEAVAAGQSLDEILSMLQDIRAKTRVYGVLNTLEYLRRSGRVGWAQFGLGTLLRIKPILQVFDSVVDMQERVRTYKRASRRLIELVETHQPLQRLAVLHANNLDGAQSLLEQVTHLFPPNREPIFMEITPAIGAHIGPGAVGFAFISE